MLLTTDMTKCYRLCHTKLETFLQYHYTSYVVIILLFIFYLCNNCKFEILILLIIKISNTFLKRSSHQFCAVIILCFIFTNNALRNSFLYKELSFFRLIINPEFKEFFRLFIDKIKQCRLYKFI